MSQSFKNGNSEVCFLGHCSSLQKGLAKGATPGKERRGSPSGGGGSLGSSAPIPSSPDQHHSCTVWVPSARVSAVSGPSHPNMKIKYS